MLKLYGITASRAFRCLWMLEELGVPYERELVDFFTGTRTPEYLAINPNGHVPALQDDDLILWESMAINLYLAEKYDKGLWPKTQGGRGLAYQWSFWVMTEVEQPLLTVLLHRRLYPEARRDEEQATQAEATLKAPFGVLNQALQGKPYLLGDTFTVADLNVAAVMSWAKLVRVGLETYPDVIRWMDDCLGRPAQKKARKS